jgi:hypothetical protein
MGKCAEEGRETPHDDGVEDDDIVLVIVSHFGGRDTLRFCK